MKYNAPCVYPNKANYKPPGKLLKRRFICDQSQVSSSIRLEVIKKRGSESNVAKKFIFRRFSSVKVAHISSYFLKFLSYRSLLGVKSRAIKKLFQLSLELLSNAQNISFFSCGLLKVRNSLEISLHAIFQFDMSQPNLNNF